MIYSTLKIESVVGELRLHMNSSDNFIGYLSSIIVLVVR